MTFGAFISTRRKEAKLNLRDTAKHLGISNGYLCDIEQGRRPAPEGAFVERISSFLELDKQEHEMLLDLAADSRQTVPADLPDYIRQHDIVRAALRVAKEVDATDEEWKAFMEMLQNRQNYAQRVKQLSADEIYRHSAETAAKESLLSALIHDSYELDDDDLDLILKPKNPVEALYQFLTSDKTDLSPESSISSILSEYNAQCQERDLTLGEEVTMC